MLNEGSVVVLLVNSIINLKLPNNYVETPIFPNQFSLCVYEA